MAAPTSEVHATDRHAAPTRPHDLGWPAWTLFGVEVFVGINAVIGGWRMIADGFGMPTDWLEPTPFSTWTWPGIALLAGVAVPQFVAAAFVTTARRRRVDLGWLAGLAVGAALVGWIVVQVAMLRRYFFLQPVIAGLGLVEMGLALWWRHRALTR